MLKGLPASGKSTYANDLINKGWKRVNKDDLRAMIDGGVWSRKNEDMINAIMNQMVMYFLDKKLNVVVDNTNFGYEEHFRVMANLKNADFEIKFFDVPVMECVERDSKRGSKSVGAKVIFGMYNKYLKPQPPEWNENKQNCYIFDIDGTLAKMNGRSPYDYTKVDTDIPNHNITMIARLLSQSMLPIIIVSGRESSCKDDTINWLNKNSIPFNALIMRKTGDNRNDAIIKKEIYKEFIEPNYNVLAVFDDRNRVVDMWRSLGLTCLQVDYGNF